MSQSPLHRGSLFNIDRTQPAIWQEDVSLPSSSGKSLQRDLEQKQAREAEVSIPSSSGKSLQPEARALVASSGLVSIPSSSGKSLQLAERSYTDPTHPCFNPLFIGASVLGKSRPVVLVRSEPGLEQGQEQRGR